MVRNPRFSYSVSEADVAEFIERNACARDFLNKYDSDASTNAEKAVGLARFFRWLKVVKNQDITPEEFLDLHRAKRSSASVNYRRWALQLASPYN